MKLVTLIIPMYNEENNIVSCMDMLRKQTNQNFEVIFIDDGSTDKTLDKLNCCLRKKVEFSYKIFKQKNSGAAAARKKGILNTETEYVMICDCDDFISDNMIEEIYRKNIEYKNYDIYIPYLKFQSKDKKWNEFLFYSDNEILNPIDCILNTLDGWKVHGCFAIKKSIFLKSYEDYKFFNNNENNYINNDEVVTRLNFLNSKEIIKLNANYYYRYNEESTTKRVNENRYLMMKNAKIISNIFGDNKILSSKSRNELLVVVWVTYLYYIKNKNKISNKIKWKKEIKKAVNSMNFLIFLNGLSVRKMIKLLILKLRFII